MRRKIHLKFIPEPKRVYTPENITELKPNDVFVFGSNSNGFHGGGAALLAKEIFGAIEGVPIGLQGQSYAIITLDKEFKKVSKIFIEEQIFVLYNFAKLNRDKTFYVTKIGTGIAGFNVGIIKALFRDAEDYFGKLRNIILPKEFHAKD